MKRPLVIALAAAMPTPAWAGAWPLPPGQTQAILKYEGATADHGFDPNGIKTPIPTVDDDSVSLFVERGLTDRLTFQGKASYTWGQDQYVRYDGRGPVELGLRYAVFQTSRTVVSVYLGGIIAGEGRNAGYAAPKQGSGDFEARLLVGRSATFWERPVFSEVQVARLFRSGLPDEVRSDSTLGWEPFRGWLLLGQVYAGRAESKPVSPTWFKVEASVVRKLGAWSLQAGWRQTLLGLEAPVESGPVVAVWRRF